MQRRVCAYASVGTLVTGFASVAAAQVPQVAEALDQEEVVYDGDFDAEEREKLGLQPAPMTVILPDGTAPAATLVPTPNTSSPPSPVRASEAYEFQSSAGAPNPNVWARTGALSAPLVVNAGLHIIDPGDGAALVFGRSEPGLASTAATAKLRAVVRTLPQTDTSRAWSRGFTGIRLLLDDGQRRLELALGRDPETGARRLEIVGASQARALPFAWDNNFHNVLEIERRVDGVFVVTATTPDPIAATTRVAMAYSPEILPPSSGRPGFAWGTVDAGGGVSLWREVRAEVTSRPPPNAQPLSSSDTDAVALPISLGTTSLTETQPASHIEIP